MTLINSEYWEQDGFLVDAGESADMNHEGHAIQAARSMLLDAMDKQMPRDDEGIDDERLDEACEEYTDEILGREDSEQGFSKDTILRFLLQTIHSDGKTPLQRREYYSALYDAAFGKGDTRDWAIEHLGWIQIKQDNFYVQTLDEATYDRCCDIVRELVDLDSMSPEEQDEALVETINVYVVDEDKSYSFRLLDFREFTFKEACPEQADRFDKMPLGPNAQLRQADVAAQPTYYGDKLGD